jgi:hypothetical protein
MKFLILISQRIFVVVVPGHGTEDFQGIETALCNTRVVDARFYTFVKMYHFGVRCSQGGCMCMGARDIFLSVLLCAPN